MKDSALIDGEVKVKEKLQNLVFERERLEGTRRIMGRVCKKQTLTRDKKKHCVSAACCILPWYNI
jgi:hypothetical protein